MDELATITRDHYQSAVTDEAALLAKVDDLVGRVVPERIGYFAAEHGGWRHSREDLLERRRDEFVHLASECVTPAFHDENVSNAFECAHDRCRDRSRLSSVCHGGGMLHGPRRGEEGTSRTRVEEVIAGLSASRANCR